MLDLTKNIKLDKPSQKKYAAARLGLYLAFTLGASAVAYKVLFPSQTLDLFFDNLNAAKNTIVNPKLAENKSVSKAAVSKDDILSFNANPLGNFSSVKISFQAADNQNITDSAISVQKSYQAFFYPTGKPLGFKSGTLLTTENGDYYIVSKGMLRRFSNPEIILSLGFPKSAFLLVGEDDLKFNQKGEDVASPSAYPDDSLFLIDEKFYQLLDGKLLAFVSSRAFLSQYQSIQAIPKDKAFFASYPVSENPLGFADATIASAGGSAFILSGGKSYPIADFNTFETMGFSWDNVIPLESDELGAYEQQKQFTLNQPHPDGTIFKDEKSNAYYIIDNSFKRPILSKAILTTYPIQNAISLNEEMSAQKLNCILKKELFPFKTFSCRIDLNEISFSKGNDYRFESKFSSTVKLKQIDLVFSTPFSSKNAASSLSKIKGNLQNNYNAN